MIHSLSSSLSRLSLQGLSVATKSSAIRVQPLATSACLHSLFRSNFAGSTENSRLGILSASAAWTNESSFLSQSKSQNFAAVPLLSQVRFRRVFKTRSRRFPGHIDVYSMDDGKRQSLAAAEERFKRLDWGVFIRTRVGKDNKRWKMTDRRKWRKENHVFSTEFDGDKFERMFSTETKRARHFPDDPFEKFNRLAWWRYHWTQRKNMENIRRYGSEVYLFDRYKSHQKIGSRHNVLPKMYYMPPGYLANVASNPAGIYTPDPMIPETEVAPHFKRAQNRPNRQKRDPMLYKIKDLEMYAGNLPVWSPLFFPTKFEN